MAEDLKPIVGEGYPLDPDRKKVLSADDEKRVDEKGRPIVDGKLWSEAASGAYLVIILSSGAVAISADKQFVGVTEIDLGPAFKAPNFKLSMMVSKQGKPSFHHPVVGACLELPDDLGRDKTKQQYIIEWIVHTVMECFEDRGIAIPQGTPKDELMFAVAQASDKAIQSLGL